MTIDIPLDPPSAGSARRRRQQQNDLQRMQLRRAIEAYAQQRQLNRELADYPELVMADYLIEAHGLFRRSV